MHLSDKLNELFLNVFSELLELSSFKFSTLSGYELVEKQYEQHIKEIEKNISTSENIKSPSLERLRLMISASQKGIHKLGGAKQIYVDRIDRSLIIHACSLFDHFINQTTNLILIEKPELLSNEKKTIPYHELLLYSKEDLIQLTIEKFIHELSYKSIADRIKHLSEKFELDITFDNVSKSNIFFHLKLI